MITVTCKKKLPSSNKLKIGEQYFLDTSTIRNDLVDVFDSLNNKIKKVPLANFNLNEDMYRGEQ